MKLRIALLASSLLLAACSTSDSAPTDESTVTDPTTEQTTAPAGDAASVVTALQTPLAGPISIKVTDGSTIREIVEDEAGNRHLRSVENGEDMSFRLVDGQFYTTAPAGTSGAGRWFMIDVAEFREGGFDPAGALDALFADAFDSLFGYSIEECLANDATPEPVGPSWVVTCTTGADLTVTLDSQNRLSTLSLGDGYETTIAYEATKVDAPTDLIPVEDMEELYAEVLQDSFKSSVETRLEAISRNGEAIFASNTTLTDAQTASAAIEGAGEVGVTYTTDGKGAVQLTLQGAPDTTFSCSGTVTFSKGTAKVSKVTCSN